MIKHFVILGVSSQTLSHNVNLVLKGIVVEAETLPATPCEYIGCPVPVGQIFFAAKIHIPEDLVSVSNCTLSVELKNNLYLFFSFQEKLIGEFITNIWTRLFA